MDTKITKNKLFKKFKTLIGVWFLSWCLSPLATHAQFTYESNTTTTSTGGYTDILYTTVVNGNTYSIGNASGTGLPTTIGPPYTGTGEKPFLVAYNSDGSLKFATMFGGSLSSNIEGMKVANGKVYVWTSTTSTDLPVTNGSTKSGIATFTNSALYILNGATGAMELCTYINDNIGMSGYLRFGGSIGIDGTDVILAGYENNDNSKIGISRISASGTLIYSKYMGGPNYSEGHSCVIQNGNTYITGATYDNSFPVTDGSNTTIGNPDGGNVLICLNASGDVVFSKYINANANGNFKLLADASGVYFVNTVYNGSNVIPTIGSSIVSGPNDFIVQKFSLSGNVIYSRFIGGPGNELTSTGMSDVVLSNGDLYITGTTNAAGYPVVNGLNYTGGTQTVLTKLNSAGGIVYSTYYGGTITQPKILDVEAGEAYLLLNNTGSAMPTTDGTTTGTTGFAKFNTSGTLCMASLINKNFNDLTGFVTRQVGMVYGDKLYLGLPSEPTFRINAIYKRYNPGVNIFDECPPVPTVATDAVSPATQTVCQNGLVQQLVGTDVFINAATSLPLYNIGGVTSAQNNVYFDYQWQTATSASGPWTDIPNATEKKYSPSPTVASTYYRRITKQGECCGGAVISTSDVSAIIVNASAAPTVDAGGASLGGILQTCPGNAVTIGGSPSASGGTAPYTYAWSNGAGTSASASVSPTQNTIYNLTVTDANGCVQVDQVVVNAFAANAGSDKGNCAGAGVQIGTAPPAGASGISYSWSIISGSAGSLSSTTVAQPIASPTVVTTYRVTMTVNISGGGTCSTTDDVIVTPSAAPTTSNFAGPDRVICFGSTTTLGTPAQSGFTYVWTPGSYIAATTSTATFDAGNINMPVPNKVTYTLSATNTATGCTFLDQVEVAVIEARAGLDGCGPRFIGEADRTPNLNETYQWTVVSGTGNFLGVTNQAVVPVGASVGGPVTYRLTTSYTLNGVTGTCTDDVVVAACGPSCSIEVVGSAGCPSYGLSNGSVTLKAIVPGDPANYTYSWSPAVGLSSYNTQSVNLTDNVARTYTVTITSLLEPTWTCTATKSVNDPSWSLPTFNPTTPVSACPNSATLIGDPVSISGLTYNWTGVGLNNPAISQPTATATGTVIYKVTVTDNVTGCLVNRDVTVNRTLAANAGYDKNLCTNGIVTLGTPAQAGYTYSWSPAGADWRNGTNEFSAQPEAFVATTTTFTLTQTHTASGCVTTDAAVVTVSPAIASFSMSNLSYCPGAAALVLGYSNGTTGGTQEVPNAAGYTYSWSPSAYLVNATLRNPTLKTPMPGTPVNFYLTVTSAGGCSQLSGPLTITPTISAVDAGIDKTICLGSSTGLGSASNATGGGEVYSWSPATGLSSASSPNPTFTPTSAGTTTFTVTKTVGGCATTDQVIVTVLGVTAPVIAPLTVCSGTSVIIGPATVDPLLTYTWSPATGLSSASIAKPTATLSASQTYTLTVTNGIGCDVTTTVAVGVNPSVPPTVTVPNINTCAGSSASFSPVVSPSGTYNYQWTPATNLSSAIVANPIVNTNVIATNTYSLLVTNATTGCYNTATNITATSITCLVTISGTVFNDPNAGNVNNSTGTTNLIPAGMTAILVGSDGNVVANATIGTDGKYTFSNVLASNYTVLLSTIAGTVGSLPPTSSLPVGWQNTGEFIGTPDTGNDPSVNGTSSLFSLITTDVVNINFGIQRAPLAVNGTMPDQANNGYSVPVTATQFSGSDYDNGTVQSIRITAFPTNAISITINGVKYSSAAAFNTAFPTGATITSTTGGNPLQSIAVQPALGNNASIVIPYVTIDNAGATSAPATVTVPFSVILPVTGLNLTILAEAGCNYRLNWQTFTEANVKSYVIQYSVNGTNWQSIGTMAAKGNSNTLLAYSYLHNAPSKGSNYYRVQVADKDGAITYSNTVQATSSCNGKGVITAYPNPAEKLLTVTGVQAGSTLLVINAAGKTILTQKATGSNTDLVNTSQLISGLYLLKAVAADGSTTTLKVVKR